MRIEFRVPDRFWASGDPFVYPRFRDRSGTPVPGIVLAYPPSGATGSIGKSSPNGFRLRVQHGVTTSVDLDLRASPTSAKGTQAAAVIRLMHEIHVLENMLNDRAATIFWQNVEGHMGKAGFLLFCVGDFFAATTDIYRSLWGRDIVTDQELTIEERLVSGMMVAVTTLTGGVPGSMAVNRGIKVLRKDLCKDVAATSRANTTGISAEVAESIGDLAEGGQSLAGVANTTRRTAGRNTKLVATALENGLRRVNSILDLPITDLLKFHGGLGRMTESQVVRSGSQAPHINPLCSLEKSAKRPVPSPSAVRAAPTTKTADATIGAAEDAAMASRTISTMKAAGASEKTTCEIMDGIQQCFPAGTLVLLGDGSWKPIEAITQGQEVMSRNQWSPESALVPRAVRGLMVSDAATLTVLRFQADDGDEVEIHSTTEHPYWVHGQGWASAKDVQAGTCVVGDEGLLRVVSKATQVATVKVYNLEITTDRTYFVSSVSLRGPPHGVWVHNNCVLRQSLEQTVRKEASAAGVQLTDKQVLEAVKELVERSAVRGGKKGLLIPIRTIIDPAIRKVLSRFTEGVAGLINLGGLNKLFQGLEIKAVHSLDDLTESELRTISRNGTVPVIDGNPINLHHKLQSRSGPIIELKEFVHQVNSGVIHSNVKGSGIGTAFREGEFDLWRKRYWKARAREELILRGLQP